jgi:hypothetical protein
MASAVSISLFLMIFLNVVDTTRAIHRMSRSSSSYCDYEWVKAIERERDDLKKSGEHMRDSISYMEIMITRNNCDEGHMFRYNKDNGYTIKCIACPANHYRSNTNTTCYHCPEGFYSAAGSAECKKAEKNSSNVHTLCPEGTIIGSNKFGYHLASCIRCQSLNKKSYMPYKNNHDTCMTCPAGSVVNRGGTDCTVCPMGYFEKDNECIKCNSGTYADKEGMTECLVCNNMNALAYSSIGGTNCDDSVFHDIANKINNDIINLDIILRPLLLGAHSGTVYLLNNERDIYKSMPLIIGIAGIAAIWFNA